MIESLEWLRPGWLLALPAGLALLWAWWRRHAGVRRWQALVDAELLAHLAGRAPASGARPAFGIAVVVLVLACAALAGPAWRAQPAALQRDLSARIVVLDLSPSMDAIDVAPSRLARARAATAALLREAGGARLGLVVFGADAFTVAPLTHDAAALLHLLEGLATGTLPRAGSRPDLGLDLARAMLERAGVTAGEVILVGDSAGDARTLDAASALADAGFPLSVLAVGTAPGGPVRLAGGALARTQAGEILVVRSDFAGLERVAHSGGGRFHLLSAGDETPRLPRGAQAWAEPRGTPAGASNARQDDGAWLALFALPFAALLFRRGWLACLAPLALALALSLPAPQAQAFEWQDLWLRPDQQAAAAFTRGEPSEPGRLLAKLRPGSPWRGMLLYRSARFAEAAAQFAAHDTARAHYNRGNALALDGRLEAALAAYGAALERNPAMSDALFNRALVREALARRPLQPQGGAQVRDHRGEPSASAVEPEALAGRGVAASDSQRRAGWHEPPPSRQGRAREEPARAPTRAEDAARQPADAPGAAELRRLEGLLSQVPDDPRSLLASRFAQHLWARGTPHPDSGARW